ncbi:amino acid ABC transporter permease [Pseudomonas sp. LRF_L74]|uniref:amino acid ABC transporter permease n=1 Tax=Pseudomonas sp. LRF_L74 TaxID=3369422 RepID=UPI003F647361
MTFLLSAWPASWSRQQRSTLAIALGVVLLMLVMWLIAIPLSYVPEPIASNATMFADGTRTTVKMTLIAAVFGIVLGLVAALGKLSGFAPARWLASFYIWIIRGTPLLVQILFVFLALPVLLPWLQMDDFTSACVALAFNAGAYNAESIRAGLLAVPRGQTEASRSLGLSRGYTFFDVVFPQAFKISLPPLVNNFIALLKDSSLAYAIGVVELTNVGNRLQAATFEPLPALITTALIYLLLTTLLTQISNAVEHRMDVEGRRS